MSHGALPDQEPVPPTELAADLLPYLAAFANGRPGPPELELQHYATRGEVTLVTRARLDGVVEIGSVAKDRPRHRVRVGREAVRRAASALLASGFPDVALPDDAPPAPVNVSPVRLAVARGQVSAVAEVSASHLDLVPEFKAAVAAVSGLAAPVRAGASAAKDALVMLAAGGSPEALVVDIRFASDDTRSFTLSLGMDGSILEAERRGPRERSRVLGPASVDEKKALARAFLDAGFPDDHGRAAPIAGPHYVVRVAQGDTSIEVVVDADHVDEHGLDKAVSALYAAAARFGMRPLELREDDPPSMRTPAAPPARSMLRSVPPGIADQLLEFAEDRITFPRLARWLAENRKLWVLATEAESGGHLPRIARDGNVAALTVFTSEPALDAWLIRSGEGGEPVVMRDTWGAALFGGMPDFIGRIEIDAASPLTLQIHGEPLTTLRAISRAVTVERALSRLDEPREARSILDHIHRVAWRATSKGSAVVTVRGPDGTPFAAAFTTDDCAEAFVDEQGGPGSGISVSRIAGRELLGQIASLPVSGLVFNQAGPGHRSVLSSEDCSRLAAMPVFSRPPSRPPL